MKKKVLVGLFITFILSLAVSAYAFGGPINCPRCGFMATPTGRIQHDVWGIHHEYKCPNGHRFFED